ncbi:MAG: bifunctional adenosylcobinamide kinase/adenosylcobinamide-phosphate guanylyltransferase [Deltaproteobacteria bacterium]|nr:MAG: bifunctional adenosylcobinamide kinase/adenosylcobinamide-phosphate guanylyltransferase [Deltaproteobacteria bacterium]
MTIKIDNFRLALITGAAKSGKSHYAQVLAESRPQPWLYVATSEALDEEMAERIARHQARRGTEWTTREEPLALARTLQEADGLFGVILVDCLTVWLSNLLTRVAPDSEVNQNEVARLLKVLETLNTPVILVTNEVGWGIVPDNALARKFRDLAGDLNQRLGQMADLVVLVVCGRPLTLQPNKISLSG